MVILIFEYYMIILTTLLYSTLSDSTGVFKPGLIWPEAYNSNNWKKKINILWNIKNNNTLKITKGLICAKGVGVSFPNCLYSSFLRLVCVNFGYSTLLLNYW